MPSLHPLLPAALLLLARVAFVAADPVVAVRNGSYAGLHLPQFGQDLFLGMPYAQDAGGANRFRVPQALTETWNGTRPATNYSHACPDADPADDAVYGMSENCLSVNVVRPAGLGAEAKMPVLVWIHGGSYQQGTSGLPNYNLTYIVQRSVEIGKPIIGASINYRKGGWGNMYSIEIQGSGNTNIALRDMRKALAWIQENIEPFGGDPGSVTIWGESSGSFAVGQLLMTYGGRTDGLFHRSIQESGSAATAWYNGSSWYQPIYDKIVDQVNCSAAIDTLACLRTVPYNTLYPFLNSSIVGGPGFYPTVDGDIMPAYPTELLHTGRFAHVPHLYGTNTDEGTDNAPADGTINTDADLRHYLLHRTGFNFPPATVDRLLELYPDDPAAGIPANTGAERFAELGWQYKRVAAIVGDAFYHAPRLDDARHYAVGTAATYVYRFNTRAFVNATTANSTDYVGTLAPASKGVSHFTEVAFVMGNPAFTGPWPEYRALSAVMGAQWVRFAHAGDPNGEGLPAWPRYGDGADGSNLVLQTEAQGGAYVEADTYRLAGREFLTEWARRRHV
ncbi:extracellular lipase [Neofusicoccum parvum]|uniref:Extracellular lipase n=1 Tax=Neofusicoccum parvum TaxID=310453 RepID=A0ACB5SM43_9PEZI|nr:extracellular lipase [Neofusicoccum parvum]